MSYTCTQKVIVIEDTETCDQKFQDYILTPCLQFIGLDCEWSPNRPIALLQVATPTVVMLVRISKMNFVVPKNVRLVLEDPTIFKVGVSIENDSAKLGVDCLCQIKSWVDLRHVAIRSSSWVPCVVQQIENLEFELKFYGKSDPIASGKRLSWSPKMGLESLISECMDMKLPKNSSARWNDDWEINALQSNQETYAANDATASLDIFIALVYSSATSTSLPVSIDTFDVAVIVEKHGKQLEDAIKGLLDVPFMQNPEDTLPLYKLIEKKLPDLDIKAYYTKPAPSKKKQERKEIYKKKKKDANEPNTQKSPPIPLPPITKSESSDTSRNSFTFQEIFSALKDTKTDTKSAAEDFVNSQLDESFEKNNHSPRYSPFEILFHFRPVSDRTLPLIPGFSYGRGSKPPSGYMRFRRVESQTQTDFEFNETMMKTVLSSFKCDRINEFQFSIHSNTSLSFRFPLASSQISKVRTESPLPKSTTDDDAESVSSYTSSNYQSCSSKQSKNRGRGRGRGKVPPSVGPAKVADSDGEVKKGRGRGRGALSLGTNSSVTDSDREKVTFSSLDIRYQDCDTDKRPTDLEIETRSRNPTTSSISSAATPRQQSICEQSSLIDVTPTNATPMKSGNFNEDDASSYSTFSVQSLMDKAPRSNNFTMETTPQLSKGSDKRSDYFETRNNSSQNSRPQNTRFNDTSGKKSLENRYPNRCSTNRDRDMKSRDQEIRARDRDVKSTNRVDINQNYEFKSAEFRQAHQAGFESLHTGNIGGSSSYTKPAKEEIAFDWGKFRESEGLSNDNEPEKLRYNIDLSDSDDDNFLGNDDQS